MNKKKVIKSLEKQWNSNPFTKIDVQTEQLIQDVIRLGIDTDRKDRFTSLQYDWISRITLIG